MPAFNIREFQKACLTLTNSIRKDYGAPPLTYSDDLEKGAKKWAKELVKNGSISHDDSIRGISENILSFSGHEPTADLIINYWLDEKQFYDFEKNNFQEKAAHFTQMIWVNCSEFGIDFEISKDNVVYVVARYSPCGNYMGLFGQNVLKFGSPMAMRTKSPTIPIPKIPDMKTIEKYFTKAHALVRGKHGAPPIVWDQNLAEEALAAAKKYIEARAKGDQDPEMDIKYGRNLTYSIGGIPPLHDICQVWYESASKYNFAGAEFQPECGSFSQMVWNDSARFGVGMAESDHKCCCICYYDPPGNVKGEYTRSVGKPVNSIEVDFESISME